MDRDIDSILAKRNPVTEARYRCQIRLQVFLPLALVFIAVVAFLILFWPGSSAAKSAYADVSLVMLILPAMVFGLVVLVFLVGMIYVIIQALRVIPGAAYQVQDAFMRVERYVRLYADKAAMPFVKVGGLGGALQAVGSIFTRDEDDTDEH
jgi:hypothetical protein